MCHGVTSLIRLYFLKQLNQLLDNRQGLPPFVSIFIYPLDFFPLMSHFEAWIFFSYALHNGSYHREEREGQNTAFLLGFLSYEPVRQLRSMCLDHKYLMTGCMV